MKSITSESNSIFLWIRKMANVKNLVEVLDLVVSLGKVVGEVVKDGKVNVWDLPKLAPLWTSAQAAIAGLDQVVGEIKDLDSAEVETLMSKMVEVAQAWYAVFAPKA